VRNATRDTHGRSFERMVAKAHDGDRLRVRGSCPSQVVIDEDLVIEGVGEATLDGQRRGRVLRIRSRAMVRLVHLTLTRGRPQGSLNRQHAGGAIHNRGTLIVIDSLVTDNDRAYSGGGIYNAGRLILRRSEVSGHGGGDQTIQGFGGGIHNEGTATLQDSSVLFNHTDYQGSGIYNSGTLMLERTTVARNSSVHGSGSPSGPGSGGIVNTGTLTLVDSRVIRNNGARGGGIGNTGTLRLIRSRVRFNSSFFGRGGGIHNSGDGTAILRNSIVADNESTGGGGGGISNGGRLTLWGTSVTSNTAAARGGGINNHNRGVVRLRGGSRVRNNEPDDCFGTPAC
jgi:hypothetical protein